MSGPQTITITMTVEQFDLLRACARQTAKRHRKSAEKAKKEHHVVFHTGQADNVERCTAIISNALRAALGEQDYLALGVAHANQAPSSDD